MLALGWQTISERGVVRSREPFKFCCAPAISLEWLIVSGAVNLGGRSLWWSVDGLSHQFITLSTSEYNTVGLRHCVVWVCQWQRRLVTQMLYYCFAKLAVAAWFLLFVDWLDSQLILMLAVLGCWGPQLRNKAVESFVLLDSTTWPLNGLDWFKLEKLVQWYFLRITGFPLSYKTDTVNTPVCSQWHSLLFEVP